MTSRKTCTVLVVVAAAFIPATIARAQHLDVLVQSVAGKLTTGAANFDAGSDALGLRVFARPFNSLFAMDDPGFNSIGSATGTLPPGADALPGGAALQWDFLPMKVNGVVSNLMYWNAAGTTADSVTFGPPPTATYSLSLFGANDLRAAAGGTAELAPGHTIATTASDGFIHQHRFFFLDNDHDDNNETVAEAGVYMAALRLRMNGLNRSEPFYVVFSTPTVSLESLAAASEWTQENVDLLAPSFSADFDGDLDVDGHDLLSWQRGVGAAAALQFHGDADGDRAVTAADLAEWRGQFGLSTQTFPGATAPSGSSASAPLPEPMTSTLAALAALVAGSGRRSQRLVLEARGAT
jgi:hypothetical protein